MRAFACNRVTVYAYKTIAVPAIVSQCNCDRLSLLYLQRSGCVCFPIVNYAATHLRAVDGVDYGELKFLHEFYCIHSPIDQRSAPPIWYLVPFTRSVPPVMA